MFGLPVDTAFAWANVISLCGLAIAVAGAIAASQLATRLKLAHDLQLQRVQSDTRTQLGIAAAEASKRAAELARVNEDLQLELQSEQESRKTLNAQLQARDMTNEQMVKFIETVRGKVHQINLFTAPGREASTFGITILDALREADVSVTWYRMRSAPTTVQGVSPTGVTIYEYPERNQRESIVDTLAKAFMSIDVQSNVLVSAEPLAEFPSPSLIIALKPPVFLRPSEEPIPSDTPVPSDLLSRVE